MSEPVNPYAPPSTDPSAPGIEVPDGSLWRVEDGRLLVRDHASLPDVCIHGSPPEEPGARKSIAFRRWRPRVFLLFLVLASLLMLVDQFRFFAIMVLIASEATDDKTRVMVFEGRATAARYRFRRALGMIALTAVAFFAFYRTPVGASLDRRFLYFGLLVAFNAYSFFFQQRAVRKADGWFELRRIAPSAIARLAEIQQQVVIRQDDIRQRRKG